MSNKERLERMCEYVANELSDVADKSREFNVNVEIKALGNDFVNWEASGIMLFKGDD